MIKEIKYIASFTFIILILSCSSSGGDDSGEMPVGETPTPDPDPIENRAPLSVSSLKYPTNNLLCINNTLDFEWEKATDPDGDNLSYIIEIAADNTFSSLIHNYTVSATSRTITLDKGEAFYWRVKAKDPKGLIYRRYRRRKPFAIFSCYNKP